MMRWMRMFVAVIAAGMLMLTGCNTVRGVGEDVEATGDAIEDAAD